MISKVKLIRNIGKFYDFACQANQLNWHKQTFLFAPNAYGKSTLVNVFRSLRNNNPKIIRARRKLNNPAQPEVAIVIDGENFAFNGVKWNKPYSAIRIFDAPYIRANILTHEIEHEHRRQIHKIIIGAQGVSLDENRRHATASLLFEISPKLRQLCVFTHKKDFLEMLFDKISHNTVLEIRSDRTNGSRLDVFDVEENRKSDYIRMVEEMERFTVEDFGPSPDTIQGNIRKVKGCSLRLLSDKLFESGSDLGKWCRNENSLSREDCRGGLGFDFCPSSFRTGGRRGCVGAAHGMPADSKRRKETSSRSTRTGAFACDSRPCPRS